MTEPAKNDVEQPVSVKPPSGMNDEQTRKPTINHVKSDWDQPAKSDPSKAIIQGMRMENYLRETRHIGLGMLVVIVLVVVVGMINGSPLVAPREELSIDNKGRPLKAENASLGRDEECRSWTHAEDVQDIMGMIKLNHRADNYLRETWHIDAMDQGKMGDHAVRIWEAIEHQCRRNPDLLLQAAVDNAVNYPDYP